MLVSQSLTSATHLPDQEVHRIHSYISFKLVAVIQHNKDVADCFDDPGELRRLSHLTEKACVAGH